ncbi:MAG: thioredoxin [Leptothrix sp. (in: Bacteria)]|nr:thioredoxin [Leptothrix sp. (in: b-proteobacteria)]
MLDSLSARPTPASPAVPLHVACLCAAWCRLCDDYAPVFEQVTATLRERHPGLQTHWLDIEDEADLLGDLDIETFPTLVVVGPQQVHFAGPLAPQRGTLQRVLDAVLDERPAVAAPAAVLAFAQRLRQRAG